MSDDEIIDYYIDRAAYYYRFKPTGVRAIDRIIGALHAAGKGYHSTEYWCEENDLEAGSYADLIQRTMDEAAHDFKSLPKPPDDEPEDAT